MEIHIGYMVIVILFIKLRKNDDINNSETYVYMAWAEAPFVNSEGEPGTAR